jgi:hypothetical protein
MPKSIDWINFIYINLAFIAQVLIMYIYTSIDDIKKNWNLYRCNPLFMPLSDNVSLDFTYCVQNIQTNFMGYLLEPLTYATSNLTAMGSEMTNTLNNFRNMFSNIRTFLTSITGNVFGVFMNLIIEFQKIIISIRDLVGKLVGVMTAVLYIMEDVPALMGSGWNGPFGQTVRLLSSGGSCFHPNTLVYLQNGNIVKMKNIELGSILENGSKVTSTMKLLKTDQDILYKFNNGNKDNIYVTGSHMIYNNETNKFIKVRDHPDATITNKNCSYFSCLITDDHIIQLGDRKFYDYDDDEIQNQ